jgi:hypothetical protein
MVDVSKVFGGLTVIAMAIPLTILACGYKLSPTDTTTLQLQSVNCAAAVGMLADAGPAFSQVRAIDRTCTCGARGILARAGKPLPDAGREGCPQ